MKRFWCYHLFIISFFLKTTLQAGTLSVPMQYLNVENGMSKSTGSALLQDDLGFMWIGTYDGLNRYDGYQFKIFRPDPLNRASLSDNYIQCLFKDNKQKIWIGTKKGLNIYDPLLETFQHIPLTPDQRLFEITALCGNNNGTIWVGTTQGLCQLDSANKPIWFNDYNNNFEQLAKGRIYSLCFGPDKNLRVGAENDYFSINTRTRQILKIPFKDKTTGTRARCIIITPDSSVLIGSDSGIWTEKLKNGPCEQYKISENQESLLENNQVYSLVFDKSDKLWIGTWGNGVFQFDLTTEKLLSVQYKDSPSRLQFVYQIIKDRTGIIWIGCKTGVYQFDTFQKPFKAITPSSFSDKGITWDVTKVVVEDPNIPNLLWISTDRGLLRTHIDSGESKWITNIPNLGNHVIHSLFMEPSGLLWLGTNGLLYAYDTKNNTSKNYPEIKHPNPEITLSSYYSILRDSQGTLWLGTFENGLIRFDPRYKSTQFFMNDPKDSSSLPDNHIWTIFEDKQKNLWIGTDQGLALMDRDNGTFKTWRDDPVVPGSLISNKIRVINQDNNNLLWIGTDGGLCKFNMESLITKCYSEKDGMPNHVVHGILVENYVNEKESSLWISTNRGILRFTPSIEEWKFFQKQDGLHFTEFSRHCYCQLKDGRMVFGGFNGFTVFEPIQFAANPNPPKVIFTNMQLFYRSVPAGKPFSGKLILPQSITYTKQVKFSRKFDIVSFEFTALYFQQPEIINYMYRLDGFNKEWIDAKGMRTVTYTNLEPGKYTLRVKAVSPDGIWSSEDAVIDISITPSFWQLWPVRLCLVILLMTGAFFYYQFRTIQIRKRNIFLKQFNLQLQQQINEKIKAENLLLKSQSQLTNSLEEKEILLRELYHRTKNNMQVILSMFRIHAKNLNNIMMKNFLQEMENRIMTMALVHQKLYESNDLSRLNLTEYINSLIKYIKSSYLCSEKRVTFHLEGEAINILIDTAIPCGFIINELVTNSLKHAFPEKKDGEITIKLLLSSQKELMIVVFDNGIGLPENFDLEKDIHIGLEFVIGLAKHQLQGTIEFRNQNGLLCQICLKEEYYKPRV